VKGTNRDGETKEGGKEKGGGGEGFVRKILIFNAKEERKLNIHER